VLPDSTTPSNFNASSSVTNGDSLIEIDTHFGIVQFESDTEHLRHARLSIILLGLTALKYDKIAKSGSIDVATHPKAFQSEVIISFSPLKRF